ncbi:MAG TPA: ATP-binding cassette domain-containing protein [Ramlibacter sp.]|nr:ATP-binding cassette domain-containing protein [Ramlibacter sp.]
MALRLEHVAKAFHRGTANERIALDDVSLQLQDGEFAVLIGSNGAGKSTLLNVVSGHTPLDAGRIEIDGRDVAGLPEHRRAEWVSRVLQDPMRGTLASMTLEENLALAEMRATGRGLGTALTRQRRERYAQVLAGFGLGLESRLQMQVGLLSGGQRQVLALAMAVLNPPRVLLLDEHTAALDPRTADLVMRATLQAIEAAHLTALMVTHNMQHAIAQGSRLIMMDAGRIRLDVAGDAKRDLTVEELVRRFQLADDKMLLAA